MAHVKGGSVSGILAVSHNVYETSLLLYPSDLRQEFGAEMVEVFDNQLSDAYSRSGFLGLLPVWFRAVSEFVTVALPARISGRMVPIVGVTAALALIIWFASYIGYVMKTACPGCSH